MNVLNETCVKISEDDHFVTYRASSMEDNLLSVVGKHLPGDVIAVEVDERVVQAGGCGLRYISDVKLVCVEGDVCGVNIDVGKLPSTGRSEEVISGLEEEVLRVGKGLICARDIMAREQIVDPISIRGILRDKNNVDREFFVDAENPYVDDINIFDEVGYRGICVDKEISADSGVEISSGDCLIVTGGSMHDPNPSIDAILERLGYADLDTFREDVRPRIVAQAREELLREDRDMVIRALVDQTNWKMKVCPDLLPEHDYAEEEIMSAWFDYVKRPIVNQAFLLFQLELTDQEIEDMRNAFPEAAMTDVISTIQENKLADFILSHSHK